MVVLREILPGAPKVFDCERLRAAITPAACAANFARSLHLHCVGCPLGREHAGGAEQPRVRPCYRCQRGQYRQIRGLCVSCYNREQEVLRGFNGKGTFPAKVADRLLLLTARVRGEVLQPALPDLFPIPTCSGSGAPPAHDSIDRSAVNGPGVAKIRHTSDGALITMLSTGVVEFERWLARFLPRAQLVTAETRALEEQQPASSQLTRDMRVLRVRSGERLEAATWAS